ncbi:hypothetical protein [Rhizobium sp. Root482]|uniref:hypothetical protein n=1 Tax=Rhizobium sp. Root482 TaxID=1736543 RepID=UPI000B1830BD|nr:hypothetical protein [Rhizobium sp. Root482]
MPLLSICMPSNRDLAGSRGAIESALAYAQGTGARLIISDNSADPLKRAFLEGLSSPSLTHISSTASDAMGNWMSTLSRVDTPFVLPMGDDDELHLVDGAVPIDLAGLPADVAGVRPLTEIWTAQDGVHHSEAFTIDAPSPSGRLAEYSAKAQGNNSIYYSIYRTSLFLPLISFFNAAHPTHGGYCDWAMCLSLFTAGRMLHDPSMLYRYDMGRWAEARQLDTMKKSLFLQAGLPEAAENFSALLMFLDLHIFSLRPSLPLDAQQRREVLMMNARVTLAGFLRQVREQPEIFDETVVYLCQLIEQEQDLDQIVSLCILLTDCIRPGLKDGYVRFFQAALKA